MKRIVISSLVTLVILGLIAVGYIYIQRYSIVTTDPVNAIPANSVFFIEANGAKNVLKKLSSENIWSAITNADSTSNLNLKILDSALSTNGDVKEIWEEKKIYLSAHLTKANSFDYLWLTNVPSSWTDEKAVHFISEAFHSKSSVSKRVYENVAVHEINVSPEKNFSFAVSKGIFIGSFTSFLIDDAIRQLKNGTPFSKSKAFTKVSKTQDAKTEAAVFINFIALRDFCSAFSSNGNTPLFNAIGSFARWSKLNATVLSNGLLFHGQTASTDTSDFISALTQQQPQKIDVTDILPSRTTLFISFGLSNYSNYFHHLLFNSVYFDSPDKRLQKIKAIENKFGVDFEKNLSSWIGNEITLAVTEPGSSSFENNSYACIRATNIESAATSLLQLQNAVNKNSASGKTDEYRKHQLGYINLAGLVPLFYGNLFSNISKFYFTTAGSYVVIANQSSAIRSFIDDYEDNKTLSEDIAYKNVARNAERTSNYYLYVNLERSKNIFRHYASDDLNQLLNQNKTILNKFSAFTFQIVNRNENIETTVQLLQSKDKINDANLLWSAQLDTALNMPPYFVTDPETKNSFIVVQDEKNNLYMIDESGNIAWKKTLPEKIMGSIHAVDAYKNGKQQIVFNTTTQLYMLDLAGADYGNFPIKLPANATNGCEVFDFDQSKNYKLFVACSNKMIYAYDISGKPMSGWSFNQPVINVTKPLQYFKVKDKDYILVYNHTGNIFLLDKKGSVRTSLKQNFIAMNSTFSLVAGDSLEEDHLVTTDTTGKVLSIYFNGTVKTKSFGYMSSEHAFAAADVDGDGKADYVFLDHHQMKVVRPDSSVIFEHIFLENIIPDLHCFSLAASQQQVGVGSADENKFYFINKDGKPSNGFPVKGFKVNTTGNWGTEGKQILITLGSDGSVYLYNLE